MCSLTQEDANSMRFLAAVRLPILKQLLTNTQPVAEENVSACLCGKATTKHKVQVVF